MDVTRRPRDMWIIDFGWQMSEAEAALFEAPFEYVAREIRPKRLEQDEEGQFKVRRQAYRDNWWRHMEPRPGLHDVLTRTAEYFVTPRVAKHRLFVFVPTTVLPDSATIAICRDDITTFGILHSRFHELWALRQGTSLEDRPRYTPTTTFETFPFPLGLTPEIPAANYAADPRACTIAAAATELNDKRETWLNPPELVDRVPEVVASYPDRKVPKGAKAVNELKKRTLTNLYNARPAWLDNLHQALDEAVAAAYGWPTDLSDDDVLGRLLALNHERAEGQSPNPKSNG